MSNPVWHARRAPPFRRAHNFQFQLVNSPLELDITTTTSSFTLPGQFSRQNLSHNVYRSGALQHFLGPDLGDRP
jgi:hypothetical protein